LPTEPPALRTAIASYPHTAPLKSGAVTSGKLRLDFVDVPTISRAFAPMVREQRFDVSEMAIATFIQAKAYGKPLVLLPIVLAARFQQSALICRADSTLPSPADLVGRRVGVRAYSQTTGMWLRGIMMDEYGVRPDQIDWITFEGAHVAEAPDPAWVARAPAGKELVAMLRDGELDAIIVGNDMPKDAAFRPVFRDLEASVEAFWRKHRFVPVNHLVAMRRDLVERDPGIAAELVGLFRQARDAAPPPADARASYAATRAALQPAIDLALRYSAEQGLLARAVTSAEIWEGLPADVA
jgi:4,5-dihydroxyphthalate decarboxylase